MPANTLHPLTSTGVSARLAELYKLNDTLLEVQATAMQQDLREWLDNNFSLTENQEDYLEMMDDETVNYLSDQLSFCLIYRLPITFIKPELPENRGRSKWVESSSSIVTTSDMNEGLALKGGFEIRVVYKKK